MTRRPHKKIITKILILGIILASVFIQVDAQDPQEPFKKVISSVINEDMVTEQIQASTYNSYDSGSFFLPPYLSESDRMGFSVTSDHNTIPLNGGWYTNWSATANAAHPGGVEYARMVTFQVNTAVTPYYCGKSPAVSRNQVSYMPSGSALVKNIQANPGALWLIGNEPDSIYNGNPIKAELYAELYHEVYTIIKSVDPTAKISAGGIVQPSPLRLEYLDKVLTHYQTMYREALPADIWNIHLYTFQEKLCDWGAGVPPFSSQTQGWMYGMSAAKDVSLMGNNLRAFRQWMNDRGYRDTPLIITEFGILYGPDYSGFDTDSVAQYLNSMFNLFRTSTDTAIGYEADNNRLLQMWNWFSTDYEPGGGNTNFGGDLFCSHEGSSFEDSYEAECKTNSHNMTAVGLSFMRQAKTYYTPYIDLQIVPPLSVVTSANKLTINTYVQNKGNIQATNPDIRLSLIEASSGKVATEEIFDPGQLGSRYATAPASIAYTWNINFTETPTTSIPYTISVEVASTDANDKNDILTYRVNWPPLIDLSITKLELSGSSYHVYTGTATMVATATVANVGINPAPETRFQFTFKNPTGEIETLTGLEVVQPLQPGESINFVTPYTITQKGEYEISGTLPVAIGPAEITNNNSKSIAIISGYFVHLPVITKNSR